MLVDKTNSGLVLYNHANLYQFKETSSYWSVERVSVFLCFHWSTNDTPPASQCKTVQWPISKTLCGPCIAALAGSVLFLVSTGILFIETH